MKAPLPHETHGTQRRRGAFDQRIHPALLRPAVPLVAGSDRVQPTSATAGPGGHRTTPSKRASTSSPWHLPTATRIASKGLQASARGKLPLGGLSGWYAPTSQKKNSANFAVTEFYEVHGPEKWPLGRCSPASCMLRYFCNVTGRRSDTFLPPPQKKGAEDGRPAIFRARCWRRVFGWRTRRSRSVLGYRRARTENPHGSTAGPAIGECRRNERSAVRTFRG